MPKKSKNVAMQVPLDMLEQMQAYMERLKLSSNKVDSQINTQINTQVDSGVDSIEMCEVSTVHAHRVLDGELQFQVGWKGTKETDWVNDKDCDCDLAISKYLKGKNIRTAFLFCRVSTPDQATTTNVSLEAQESELRAAVSAQGYFERIKVFSISKSAYLNIPKVLSHIGNVCLKGDGIFVWRVDRLSRNIVKYLSWMEDLNERGVCIYSQQENITYSNNKLAFLQAVLDAQKEASILGERVKMSYRLKRQRGDERVGGLPYGKKYNRILKPDGSTLKKTVVDNLEEMAIIDRIHNSDYRFAREIADDLNSEGLKKRGKKWTRMSVIRIHKSLRNSLLYKKK